MFFPTETERDEELDLEPSFVKCGCPGLKKGPACLLWRNRISTRNFLLFKKDKRLFMSRPHVEHYWNPPDKFLGTLAKYYSLVSYDAHGIKKYGIFSFQSFEIPAA